MLLTHPASQAQAAAILEDLIPRVQEGKCVLFVGPGASLPPPGYLGPPGPALFAGEIALRLESLPSDITLPWVAQLFKEKYTPRDLQDLVARRFGDHRYRPTLAHHLIAGLHFDIIISTAYDVLLDRLIQNQDSAIRYVLEDDDLPSPRDRQLIKLYGTVSHPGSLRVTEGDLETLYDHLPGVRDLLRVLSRTHALLFVGYDLGDATFRRLFTDLRRQLEDRAPAAFIIQPNPEQAEVALWHRRYLITITAEPAEFLMALQAELARRQGDPPPREPELDLPPPLQEDDRRQLNEVVARLLNQMGIGGTAEIIRPSRTITHNLDFLRQFIDEHGRVSGLKTGLPAATPAPGQVVATDEARILLQLGHAVWAEQNYDRARQYFEDALKLAPEFVDAYYSLHYLLAETRDLGAALDMYRRALAIPPQRAVLPPNYVVEAVLGMGALGVTYQVRATGSDAFLAVTVLKSAFGRNADALSHFQASMEPWQHPRISRLVEVGQHNGRYYIAREHIAGPSLARRLRELRARPLPADEAFTILAQVAEALEYAHQRKSPHLGLNPSSILYAGVADVRVTQFGEAALIAELSNRPAGEFQASDYLSPEQQAGYAADKRSDIYALGTIAYEIFTGRLPGVGAFEPPSQINPEADEALDVLVARARAIDPAQRFSTVEEMRREIQRIAQVSRPVGVAASVRWVLRLASRGLEWLMAPPRIYALVLLLVLAGLAEVWFAQPGAWSPLAPIRVATRVYILSVIDILLPSLLCYWWVRERARTTGLGSLIRSGRGMGVVLGSVMTLWHLMNLEREYEPVSIGDLCPGVEILAFLLVALLFTLGVTFFMLLSVQTGGRLMQRLSRRYTVGFYGTFLLWCALMLVLAVTQLLSGLLNVPAQGTCGA